jgi:hypothetical protein
MISIYPWKTLFVTTFMFFVFAFSNIANSATAIKQPVAVSEKKVQAVEYAFIQSLPGQREALKKFIIANWFAMDAVAVKQELMVSYELLDSGDDSDAWNIIVAVTYPNRDGYQGIATAFEIIRRAHQTVLIEGKSFKDLGKVVSSRKLYRE